MRKLFLLVIFFSISFSGFSQNQKLNTDSIAHIIRSNSQDSLKAKLLYQLAKSFINENDSAQAAESFLKGIKICEEKKLYTLLVYGYGELAYLYELAGDNIKAIKYYDEAIKVARSHNDLSGAARNYQNKNFVYNTIGEIHKSILFLDTAISIYQKISSDRSICASYNILGLRYHAIKKDSLAILYFNKAISLADKLFDVKLTVNPYINIGLVFLDNKQLDIAKDYFVKAKKLIGDKPSKSLAVINNNLGIIAYEKNHLQEAIIIYKENEAVAKAVKANDLYTDALNNLASCYNEINDYTNAEKYFQLALQEKVKSNETEGIAINYINYADFLRKQKKFDDAIKMVQNANNIILLHDGLIKLKPSIYETLAQCYKEKGDLQKAFDYLDSQYVAKDKIINEKSNTALLELQTKYETEKKDLKINVLSKVDSIKSLRIQNQQLKISDQILDLSNKRLLLARDSVDIAFKNQSIQKGKLDSSFQDQRIRQLNKEKLIQSLELQNKKLELQQKNFAIGAVAIITFLIVAFIFNRFKIRAKQKEMLLQQQIREEQKLAKEKVFKAEENERQRISRDLHDNMGAYTTALLLNVQKLKEQNVPGQLISKMEDNAQQILSSLRETIWMLNNKEICVSDLSDAFKNYTFKLLQNFESIEFDAQENIDNNKILPAVKAIHIYKILQECFQNIIKHATAKSVYFNVQSNEKLVITIADNGTGFNSYQKSWGNGLENMQWRAKEAGFNLSIFSETKKGTRIILSEI